jgi:hypothetical protein
MQREGNTMAQEMYEFEKFSTREGFNQSLNHFQAVSSLLDDFEEGENLADILNELLADNEIEPNQLNAIIYALLVDKYGYFYRSSNLVKTVDTFDSIYNEVSKWKAADIVISYHHPDLGYTVINPKNKSHWESLNNLKSDELLNMFVGYSAKEGDEKLAEEIMEKLLVYLDGRMVKVPQSFYKGKFSASKASKSKKPTKKPARTKEREERKTKESAAPSKGKQDTSQTPGKTETPQAKPQSKGKRRMTPMYSVPVTNELFHNGNVEAWKRIIQSYETANPGCEVMVFYDGERIHDINTLFKWGKVKHGSAILFAVAGEEIKDVAKLQRYFRTGASSRFEDFLKFPVNTVLNLF